MRSRRTSPAYWKEEGIGDQPDKYHFMAKQLEYGERSTSHIDRPDYGKPKNIKSAVVNSSDVGAGSFAVLRDPYNWANKIRFEESYRMDPVVRSAINRKVSFILGKELKTQFDLIDSFSHPKEKRTALNMYVSDQEYLDAKSKIDEVHRRTKFQHKLKGATIQAKVYGRSALLIDEGSDGYPDNIKILNSKLLGNIRIDEETWQLQQIQYNTNNRGLNDPYNMLDAEDIIYFANLDFHVSPYTSHFGLSDIEPIQHISEVNRILNEEDFKETNFSMWAGFGLIKIPSMRNPTEITSFLSQFQAGKWTAISQDIQVEVHELQKDLQGLINERNENERLILRALNVPSMILGFEEIQNFATAAEVMIAWKESVIEEERTWLNDTLSDQWFDTLLAKALNVDNLDDLKIRIKLAFEDIALENLKDKTLSVLPLYEAGVLPAEKVLEILGYDDVLDQMSQLQSKVDQAHADFISTLSPEDRPIDVGGQQGLPGNPYSPGNTPAYPPTTPRTILKEIQKEKGIGQPAAPTAAPPQQKPPSEQETISKLKKQMMAK
jgi:hypothetical protein